MNEPKKSAIEAAVKKKWPKVTGIFINRRKHRLRVTFGGLLLHPLNFSMEAGSHRELLDKVEKSQAIVAA